MACTQGCEAQVEDGTLIGGKRQGTCEHRLALGVQSGCVFQQHGTVQLAEVHRQADLKMEELLLAAQGLFPEGFDRRCLQAIHTDTELKSV